MGVENNRLSVLSASPPQAYFNLFSTSFPWKSDSEGTKLVARLSDENMK